MREKILYIVCMAFTALLFSCSKDAMDDELLPVTRAQLSIGLEDKSEVERQVKAGVGEQLATRRAT